MNPTLYSPLSLAHLRQAQVDDDAVRTLAGRDVDLMPETVGSLGFTMLRFFWGLEGLSFYCYGLEG